MDSKYFVQLIGTRTDNLEHAAARLGCRTQIIEHPEEQSPDADICLASGVHYIIKPHLLRITRLGIWGFHETRLPEGRGCAPLQWTVLNDKRELTVSFFELIEKFDTGLLLGQLSCQITTCDLLEDLRGKATALSISLLDEKLLAFLDGRLQPIQQEGKATRYRRRSSADSCLDLDSTLRELWNIIRVCDNEAYPAWFEIEGQKFFIKRYRDKD
jgi:methionyl-tRNA formyltransferase